MPHHFQRAKYRDEDRIIAPSLEGIERAYDVLLALPERDTTRFFKVDDHQTAADMNDLSRAYSQVFLDAYNWLKLFWYSSAYKARQLTDALVQSYNTDNFLAWLILGRSTLEYAAVTYYFVKKLNRLQLGGPRFAASHLKAFDDLMLQYCHGTRFNWPDLLAGNREKLMKDFNSTESSKAVNVLTALSHLARRDERYKDVEIAYQMLSDFAHPNMASHATVVEMPAAQDGMHKCGIAVRPSALRGEFIMVVSLPWVAMGIGTTVELLVEVAPLIETWLSYIDECASVTIDFTE
jgi:hypothetical protein